MSKDDYDTFPKLLVRNYQKWPDIVAMRKKNFGIWKEYHWKDCLENVKYFSLGLIYLGLNKGDRVAIIGKNEPEWFWVEFAVQSASGIAVGIYADMVSSEVKCIADHTGHKFVIVSDQGQVDKFLEIKEKLPELQKIIYWDPRGLRNYNDSLLMAYEEVLRLGKRYEISHPNAFEENVAKGTGEDIAAFYYTSGTGGTPKAAMVSHKALISSGKAFLEYNPISNGENLFSCLPMAWIGEGAFTTSSHLLNGVVLNFAEEPETVQEDLREIAPHVILCGPRQWEGMARTIQQRMLEAGALNRLTYRIFSKVGYRRVEFLEKHMRPSLFWVALIALGEILFFNPLKENFGLKKCKIATTGSSVTSIDAIRFWSSLGIRLKQLYVSTEAGFVAGHRSEDIRLETLGNISSVATVKISEEGEILVQGPATFCGYYKDPEKTEETLVKGWVHTGDAGYIDKKGHLVLFDRISDFSCLANGAKYAPQYIEGRLRFSPYIKDAMVLSGKRRNYLSVIIVIDFEKVRKWAEDRRINYKTIADLSQKDELVSLVRKDLNRLNKDLPDNIQIRKFVLLHKEFDPDEGELTRTRKLRRGFIEERYFQLVDAIYNGKVALDVEVIVKYKDGREGTIKNHIKIWEAV